MTDLISELSRISGYEFKDRKIGLQALTHSSYAKSRHIPLEDNERLEFLGDAVLELCVSKYLFSQYPNMHEGELTRSRSWLVREDSLYKAAVRMGLNQIIRINEAEEKIGGRGKPSILSDAYEAVIAAIYLDGGYLAADAFICRTLLNELYEEDVLPRKDPKSLLQEQVHSKCKTASIRYDLLEASGPDHKKTFRVSVSIANEVYGEGVGFSKQAAEESAANVALEKIKTEQTQK